MKEKLELLSSASAQLKKEFIGIDEVIDKVISSVTPWYVMPELIDRPIIVNLWGLTGTGKTSLVKRLIEILDYDNKVMEFNIGEAGDKFKLFKYSLLDIHKEIGKIQNPIIILDEFQHFRTLDESGREMDESPISPIWELIDSGKVYINEYNYSILLYIDDALTDISNSIKLGIDIEDSLTIPKDKEDEFFSISLNSKELYERGRITYKDKEGYECNKTTRYRIVTKEFLSGLRGECDWSIEDLRKFLSIKTLTDLKNELLKIYKMKNKRTLIDYSKSIIFIIGNLDEAYPMHGDFNPDISADEYYEMTRKITINVIKSSLKSRFRSEQISRLGNNHIIYTSLRSNDFERIIDLSLNKISERYKSLVNISIEFDDSLKKLLYSESVYPMQGVRPIYTTINNIITSKLPEITIKSSIENLNSTRIFIYSTGSLYGDSVKIKFRYYKDDKLLLEESRTQELVLGKLRKGGNKKNQIITAVHESGHAIVYTLLFNKLPNSIVSVSSDGGGFISKESEDDFKNKESLWKEVSVGLAGLCAETLVFGEGNESFGSSSDLKNITGKVINSYYSFGLYKPMTFSSLYPRSCEGIPMSIPDSEDSNNKIMQEVEKFITNSKYKVIELLSSEKDLLKNMSLYLSENREMPSEVFIDMINKFGKKISLGRNNDCEILIDKIKSI